MSKKKLDVGIGGVNRLESSRNNFLKSVVIDVCKRDREEGTFNIDCIFYVMQGVRPESVEGAIKKACIDVFGHKPDPNEFELAFINPYLDNGKKISFEVMGNPDSVTFSFVATVKHPRSLYYTIEGLTETLTNRLNFHLDK